MQGPGRVVIDHSKTDGVNKPIPPIASAQQKQIELLEQILAELKRK